MNKKVIFPLILSLTLILSGCVPKTETENPVPTLVPTVIPSSPTVLVGNDKDEHGCIGSAGYSWCQDKNKCIRIWEEDCGSAAAIKAAIIKKDNIKSEFTLTISHENVNYASGQISFGSEGGGMFLAAKVNDQWQIVYSGNGSIDCQTIKAKYEFTPEMLTGFCD